LPLFSAPVEITRNLHRQSRTKASINQQPQ